MRLDLRGIDIPKMDCDRCDGKGYRTYRVFGVGPSCTVRCSNCGNTGQVSAVRYLSRNPSDPLRCQADRLIYRALWAAEDAA